MDHDEAAEVEEARRRLRAALDRPGRGERLRALEEELPQLDESAPREARKVYREISQLVREAAKEAGLE